MFRSSASTTSMPPSADPAAHNDPPAALSIGVTAMSMLIDILEGRPLEPGVVLPTEMILRESTAKRKA